MILAAALACLIISLPVMAPAMFAASWAGRHKAPAPPPPTPVYAAPNPAYDAGWDWVSRQNNPELSDCDSGSDDFRRGCEDAVTEATSDHLTD